MKNRLIKNVVVTYAPGIPGIPPSPGLPARDVYEERVVCRFVQSDGGGAQSLDGPSANGPIYLCRTESVLVHYPAMPSNPGRPAVVPSTRVDYRLGWNSGGRSATFISGNGFAEFKVRASVVGVICGLNADDSIDAQYNGSNIDHAFSMAHGVARIVERGVTVATVGAYTDAVVFRIERVGTAIVYSKDAAVVHTTNGATAAPLSLEAALYAGSDEVFDPVLTQVDPPDLTPQTGQISATLTPLIMFGAVGGHHAELNAALPVLLARLEAGLSAPAYAVLAGVLPPLFSNSTGLTGEIGALNAMLPAVTLLAADHPYAELNADLPALLGSLWAVEGHTNATLGSIGLLQSTLAPSSFFVATMTSGGVFSATLTSDAMVSAEMVSRAELGSTFDVSAVLEAVMMSVARSGAVLGVPETECETWVVNLDSSGTTTYSNYAFKSFAQIGGKFFGAGPSGIVELAGDTDNGLPIHAHFSFGTLDFGSAMKKTVSHCYLGMSAAGNLFVKVIAEGATYVYKTRSYSTQMQQQRVTFGKGLRTNYVTLEVYNEDGADFELDAVEFHVADLARRI